jgi:hypothetical protein
MYGLNPFQAWNKLTLADSNNLENKWRKFADLCYNRFIQPNSFYINQCWIIYILKRFIPDDKILTLYHLLFSRTKFTVFLFWTLLVSVYPLRKLETFPLLMSVMSQDLAIQHGASRLQTTSANLPTFSINITSPLMIIFLCLIPLSYVIIVLPVLFYCLEWNFSLVPFLALVLALVLFLLCTI